MLLFGCKNLLQLLVQQFHIGPASPVCSAVTTTSSKRRRRSVCPRPAPDQTGLPIGRIRWVPLLRHHHPSNPSTNTASLPPSTARPMDGEEYGWSEGRDALASHNSLVWLGLDRCAAALDTILGGQKAAGRELMLRPLARSGQWAKWATPSSDGQGQTQTGGRRFTPGLEDILGTRTWAMRAKPGGMPAGRDKDTSSSSPHEEEEVECC